MKIKRAATLEGSFHISVEHLFRIPVFEHRKKLSIKLFDNDNDWNYVYFPIFMAVYLGLLAERRDGLKFISE